MNIKWAKYFSIDTTDKPGELTHFTHITKDGGVDLACLWGFSVGQGKAKIIAVPKDPEKFMRVAKAAGLTDQEGICFFLTGEDKVGAFTEMLDRIASEGINLHAVNAIAMGGRFACYLWVEGKDFERLMKLLKGKEGS